VVRQDLAYIFVEDRSGGDGLECACAPPFGAVVVEVDAWVQDGGGGEGVAFATWAVAEVAWGVGGEAGGWVGGVGEGEGEGPSWGKGVAVEGGGGEGVLG